MSTAKLRGIEADVGRLLETHDTTADLSEYGRYRDDPLGFLADVLGSELWAGQREIVEAVEANPLTAVRSCNGAGKDYVAARLAVWWAVARGGLAVLSGPTLRQVRTILFGEVRRAWSRTDLPGELFEQELRIDREAGAGIIGLTASEVGALTGHHQENVFGVVTEAQSCGAFVYEAMLACCVGASDRILACGNPVAPSGTFFTISQPGSGWHAIRLPASSHPNVVSGETVIPGAVTVAFVRRMAEQYGERSPIYQSRVEAHFPTQAAHGVFDRDMLEASVEADVPEEGPLVAAIDPARYGLDRTVLAIRQGNRLLQLHEWGQLSTTETTRRAAELLRSAGIEPRVLRHKAQGRVVVDSVGIGAGVADQLKDAGFRVSEYKAGTKATDAVHYADKRSESAWTLRERLERGEVRLLEHEQLFVELLAHEWRDDGTGRVQLEPKDRIKDRLGKSPDYADAVLMCFDQGPRKVSAVWGRRRRPDQPQYRVSPHRR